MTQHSFSCVIRAYLDIELVVMSVFRKKKDIKKKLTSTKYLSRCVDSFGFRRGREKITTLPTVLLGLHKKPTRHLSLRPSPYVTLKRETAEKAHIPTPTLLRFSAGQIVVKRVRISRLSAITGCFAFKVHRRRNRVNITDWSLSANF